MTAGMAIGQSIILKHDTNDRAAFFSLKNSFERCRHINFVVKLGMFPNQPSLYLKPFLFQLIH